MHELGITQSIIDIAIENAEKEQAKKITSIRVAIGELSGVVSDSVSFCFEACSKGTLADGAELIIDEIAGRGKCRDCGEEVSLKPQQFNCSACGSYSVTTISGDEMRIIELEID